MFWNISKIKASSNFRLPPKKTLTLAENFHRISPTCLGLGGHLHVGMEGSIVLALKLHLGEPRPQGRESFATKSWSHNQFVGFSTRRIWEFANDCLAKVINIIRGRNDDRAFSNLSNRPSVEQVHP